MLNERELSKIELEKREEFIKDLKGNKRGFVKRYGKDAEKVMYAIATKRAKKQNEEMNKDKIRGMIKDSLKNPEKADLNKDGKLSDYEKKRGAAIEKSMTKEGVEDVIDPADYGKIGDAYLKGTGQPHSLDLDQLETLGRKIVKQLYKGDFKAAKAKFLFDPEDSETKDLKNQTDQMAKDAGISESNITEDKQEAADELQMIMNQLYELSDQAKMIFRNNFPGEYSRLDAYGALDFGTSSNRYDVTLEGALENLDMEDDDEDMMQEDLDLGHQDNEPHMLKGDLYRIGKYAMELYQMVDQFEGQGEVDFPHWWQSKVIKAKDMLVGAKHYLDFEVKEPQIDAMVDVAQDVEAIDEGTWSVGTSKEIKNIMGLLDVAMDIKDPQELIDFLDMHSKSMYNIVGDDLFFDDIDGAKSEAAEGNMDRAQNRLSDAYSRAEFFQERQMDREGIKEEEAGEVDKLASDIQKAMNATKGDESKTYLLQKARTAMNKGDLGKAKKIADRIAKILKNK